MAQSTILPKIKKNNKKYMTNGTIHLRILDDLKELNIKTDLSAGSLTDIAAVERGSPPLRGSGITHLVVHNEMDASTDSVVGEL